MLFSNNRQLLDSLLCDSTVVYSSDSLASCIQSMHVAQKARSCKLTPKLSRMCQEEWIPKLEPFSVKLYRNYLGQNSLHQTGTFEAETKILGDFNIPW